MSRNALQLGVSFALGVLISAATAVAHEESECTPCPPCDDTTTEAPQQQETIEAINNALEAIKKAESSE